MAQNGSTIAHENNPNGHKNGYPNGINGSNGGTNGRTNGYTNGVNANGSSANSLQHSKHMPIAICGMGLRLPKGIHSDAALYEFLVNKGDARTLAGKDRYNSDAYYRPDGKPGSIISEYGYFLDGVDLSHFDSSMFTMTPAEIEQLDPNQRLLLEVVREALESSGEADWRGKKINTYVGLYSEDWQDLHSKDTQSFAPYQLTGQNDFVWANRIAYDMIVKSACSSAGVALHLACQSIRLGECSSAVVAGANLIMAPGMSALLTAQGTLAPDGSSKTFDVSADGYGRGEGVSALYVKRLDEAIRDGNPVRAIIRASATNVDGKTAGLTMPSTEAHEYMIRRAYQDAGLDLSKTAMFECHGTGTAAGDPVEVKAIANCFGKDGIYIGSVKPNLGHSEGNSAITSIVKAVLSLENRTIIPNIKFKTPNPAIPWEAAKLTVPVEPMPWPANRDERISVNSFGISGSNVHIILDSAASFGLSTNNSSRTAVTVDDWRQRKELLLFSANHATALKRAEENYERYLEDHPDRLQDLAYTLAQRREHLKIRSFCVTDGTVPFTTSSQTKSQAPIEAAFVFTGQGAQWPRMGRDLMADCPPFLASIRAMDEVLQSLKHAPPWSLEDVLSNSDEPTVRKAEYSQPICTALQVALVDLLASYGVQPSAVVGHSSGEIAAAYAAGALTAREAIITAFYRGYVCRKPLSAGGMAAIGLGRADVTPYLSQGVRIACENSASSVTISGDLDRLEEVMTIIKGEFPNALVRKLQVEMAYHSHHMQVVGDTYHDLISHHLAPKAPRVPFYSSVKLKALHDPSDFGPRYWQDNLESPVLFRSGVKRLLSEHGTSAVHLEVGPHSALAGPLRETFKETSTAVQYVTAQVRGKNGTVSFLEGIGQLYAHGYKITLPSTSEKAIVLKDLPAYPWHYEGNYWAETRVEKNWRLRKYPVHDLLGVPILEGIETEPTWRNVLRTVDVPWLRDHRVGNDVVFPAAAYIAMAGEAIFQLTGVKEYTVRDVALRTAMVLRDDKSTEIITNIRRQRLTTTQETDWYEFSVNSHDGTTWTKHAWGLVASGRASAAPTPNIASYDKKVSSKRWYKTMARVGFNYGPKFTGLEDITASVTSPKAALRIQDRQDESESSYPIHPTTIDFIIQSWTVAITKGEYRTLKTLVLPTFVEELYIGDGTKRSINVNTEATSTSATARGSSFGVAEGEVVFYLKGFQGTPLEDIGLEKPPELTVLNLQWKPDIDFSDATELMRPAYDLMDEVSLIERLYVLCAIEAKGSLAGVESLKSHPHQEIFRSWIDDEVERFKRPGYPLVEDSAELVSMDEFTRRNMIEEVFQRCQETNASDVAASVYRSYDRIVDVYEGRIEFLDVLLEGGVLSGIYNWMNNLWDLQDFFQLLGNSQPQIRILEIGAGTGGLTAKILKALKSDFGERLYFKYTFTDVSSGFFVQAQERFKDYQGIEYKVLDITKDPLDQGFNAAEYDLIIASNVLHATPSLQQTLTNVRTLLHLQGRLFLQELSPITRWVGFIMGMFSGWWEGDADGRFGGPFISPQEWDTRLRRAGFDGCDSVTYDHAPPYQVNANIIARPAVDHILTKKVTLLPSSEPHPFEKEAESRLRDAGYVIDHYLWGQDPPVDQDLISLIDLNKPLFQDIQENDMQKFLDIIGVLQQSRVLWITPPAQINCKDPHAAHILGMARTIRAELAMSFATLELEDTAEGAANAIVKVLQKIQCGRDTNSDLEPDLEYAYANGRINLSRFHWTPVVEALAANTVEVADAKELVLGKRGLLEAPQWMGQKFHELRPDEVRVRIVAAGLELTDEVFGDGHNAIGMEGAGYVVKSGSDVKHIQAGDRVMVIGTNSIGLATEIQRPAEFCVKIPDGLKSEDAATMPVPYVTALRCFVDKANLRKGQSVLVHNATSAVGLAAIHVAKWIGAQVYATVGSEEDTAFLIEEFGIPPNHIFNSGNTNFLNRILEETEGRRVDVVLNSLSGELLHASWKCVAVNGCMLHLGKRDIIGKGQLAMDMFEGNRTFFGVDIPNLTVSDRTAIARLMSLAIDLYSKGNIKPIQASATFDADRIEEAFRYLQEDVDGGKIVINFSEKDKLPLALAAPPPAFRNDASYLLVGGLGGLGKSIATWMSLNGAKNLIFLSRSAGHSDADQELFNELKLTGCSVQYVAGDVTDRAVVQNAVDQASKPIAGVMQMAMVLRDVGVMDMDQEKWDAAVQPKVQGTWNLHHVLPDNLDFFVLFSSYLGIMGSYGQSNYSSSNTFLDAFAQYRQERGLPATVMSIGPVEDTGFISRTQTVLDNLKATSARLITEQDFLDYLQLAISNPEKTRAPQTPKSSFASYCNPRHFIHAMECSLPITHPQNNVIWKRDPRMAIYRNIEQVATDSQAGEAIDALRHFLASATADPRRFDEEESVALLAHEILKRVSTLLMKGEDEIDTSQTLTAIGVDSLVAIELRSWWKQNLGIETSTLELMGGGSIQQLGGLAAGRLKDKVSGNGD
ncbi:putative polyketide synthase [Bisporella sp. PMI_857]|nr:putative polyketide synthase [Bisporella sp. PMI_857]